MTNEQNLILKNCKDKRKEALDKINETLSMLSDVIDATDISESTKIRVFKDIKALSQDAENRYKHKIEELKSCTNE